MRDIYIDSETSVVLLTNVQRVIATVTMKAVTKKVLANAIKAARVVTFCHGSTSVWVSVNNNVLWSLDMLPTG